jgi:aryl-alcohol dehydrogenase-like predicted oxidoreductase
MRYRTLGRTGLQVSEISLGGLFFGKLAGDRDTASTIAKANGLGINLIDTAAAYDGSEEDLGKALKKTRLRDKFLVATKWWAYNKEGQKILTDPAALRSAVEGSLTRLQTDRIDLFQFHSVTFPGNVDEITGGPLRGELEKLKAEGKIRFLGISNSGEWDQDDERLQEASRSGLFDAVMPEFLLFRQRPVKSLFPVCAKNNTGIITIIPLGQAAWGYGLRDHKYLLDSMKTLIGKKKLPDEPRYHQQDILDFLLDEKTRTIPAAALRYCLSFPEVSTVCCGTNNTAHLEENAMVSEAGPYDAERLALVGELFGGIA